MSRRPTIKDLEAQIATLRELREGEARATERMRGENAILKASNEELMRDKRWLQQIVNPLAQAIHTRS